MTQQHSKRQIQEALRAARGLQDDEEIAYWEAELENIKKREVSNG